MKFVIQFDNNYREWGMVFLQSAARNTPDCPVLVYGVNFTDDTIGELSHAHPDVKVFNDEIDFDGPQERHGGGGEKARWKILMQNRFCEIIKRVADEEPHGKYLFTGADVYMLRDPGDIVGDDDVAILVDEKHSRDEHLSTGIVVVNTSTVGGRLFTCLYSVPSDAWGWDQKLLWKLWKERSEDISFIEVGSDDYIGMSDRSAVMWHGHRGDKAKNLRLFQSALVEGI